MQIEMSKIAFQIANLTMQIEMSKIAFQIVNLTMQIEINDEPYKVKKYVSGVWIGYPVKFYNGSWLPVIPKWYSNGTWNS
jgi:hypothetical protein